VVHENTKTTNKTNENTKGGVRMFPNLKAELARRRMNMKDLSEQTGIPLGGLYARLRGDAELTFKEAINIRNTLGVDMTLEELFATE
jgi:DNA-binding phage protein